jgi:hypothetical protein
MSDQPQNEQEVEELRDAAEELGVKDAEQKDADELLHDARESGADSAGSPTQWQTDPEDAEK